MFKKIVIILFSIFVYNSLLAQNVPPALFVDMGQGRAEKKSVALKLSKLDVKVRIYGYIAETQMTMTFYNPNNRALAGDLYFPLPEGSAISGYGLDIKGVLVDGVVVEKQKARQVFEKIVRQGIDPGLVEWVKGNNFKTRVFPIPANGSRTVMVKYVSDVFESDGETVYHLPMNFKKRIKSFSIRVEVVKGIVKPKVREGSLDLFSFKKWRDSFIAETKIRNAKLTEDLIIALPQIEKQKVLVEKGDDGAYYFAINDLPKIPKMEHSAKPKLIRILWDATGSRGLVNHRKELGFIKYYFKKLKRKKITVKLYLFRNKLGNPRTFVIRKGNSKKLIAALKTIRYDGGTQMGVIAPKGRDKVDFTFLFTDGLSNFGKEKPQGFKKPVYIFSADAKSNHSFLHYVALTTGGQYFNLKRVSNRNALRGIGDVPFGFIRAGYKKRNITESYPSVFKPVYKRFSLMGKLHSKNGKITLQYGRKGNVSKTKTYRISQSQAVRGDLLQRMWAQKKVEELQIFPKKNEKEIIAVGKKYGLVTPGTSLIVLESLNQYIEHKISPPKSLPEMRKQYRRHLAQKRKGFKAKEEQKIQYVLALWERRVKWWNTKFDYPKNYSHYSDKGKKSRPIDQRQNFEGEGEEEDEGDEGEDEIGASVKGFSLEEYDGTRVYFRGPTDILQDSKMSKKLKRMLDRADYQEPAATIEIKPRDPNTPYLAVLKETDPNEYFDVYMGQRNTYGSSPAFFLDCADFFFRRKKKALGIQVLSNIAELELENAALIRVLAHKLAQINELDISISLFEEALKLRPEEPQSYRDLALVLSQRADEGSNKRVPGQTLSQKQQDYKRALELLHHVVMNKWDRFAEIEVITLMEANRLIKKARKAKVDALMFDDRLIKLLTLDVRIVLSWDADLTDMDLWVTEPSGEKAYYSNNRTRIGGLVSRDFTRGYGPEEYLLKKAMKGVYKVEANFYGSSAPKLIGAVTLQLDVYTNYGRKNEKKKSITLRLENRKDSVLVANIRF